MKDVIVVGAGIIGATVAKALTEQGCDVLLLDDRRPLSGTAPSGGHLRPSWFGGMKKEAYEPAMELLNRTWGLLSEEFVVRPLGVATTVYRVDIDKVLTYPFTQGKVLALSMLNNYPLVRFSVQGQGMQEERCRLLVVATGSWAGELIPGLKVTAKQGVSFRFPGRLEQPFIQPWAPFKQVVAHQQTPDSIWVGDGSAILPQNWEAARTTKCLERCRSAIGVSLGLTPKATVGLRPYCAVSTGEPCLLWQLGPRAWVATGAGKMGTIAAGWVAVKLTIT